MPKVKMLGSSLRPAPTSSVRPLHKRGDEIDAFYHTAEWQKTSKRIKRRDGYRCTDECCQTPGRGYGGRLICDHIVARRDGGSDDDDNLRTLCPSCDNRRHSEKGSRSY